MMFCNMWSVDKFLHLIFCYFHSHYVSIYTIFKSFATELSLALFLGLDAEDHPEITESIIALTTTHWHGKILYLGPISLPAM